MVPGVGANATAIGGATKANKARAAIATAMRKRTPLLNAVSMLGQLLHRHDSKPSPSLGNRPSSTRPNVRVASWPNWHAQPAGRANGRQWLVASYASVQLRSIQLVHVHGPNSI